MNILGAIILLFTLPLSAQTEAQDSVIISTQPKRLESVELQSFTPTAKKLAKLTKVNSYDSLSAQEFINLH